MYQTLTARFLHWISGKSPEDRLIYSFFARKRGRAIGAPDVAVFSSVGHSPRKQNKIRSTFAVKIQDYPNVGSLEFSFLGRWPSDEKCAAVPRRARIQGSQTSCITQL